MVRAVPHVLGSLGVATVGWLSLAVGTWVPDLPSAACVALGSAAVLMVGAFAAVQYRRAGTGLSIAVTSGLLALLAVSAIWLAGSWPTERQSGYFGESAVLVTMGLGLIVLAVVANVLGALVGTPRVPGRDEQHESGVITAIPCLGLGLAIPVGAFGLTEYLGWGSSSPWVPAVICAFLGTVVIASAGAAGVILSRRAVTPQIAGGMVMGLGVAILFGGIYGPFVLLASALPGSEVRLTTVASGLLATIGACAAARTLGPLARVAWGNAWSG